MILFPSTSASASAFFSFFFFFSLFVFFGRHLQIAIAIDWQLHLWNYRITLRPITDDSPIQTRLVFFFLYISTLNWSMDASIKPLFLWSGNSASGYKISHCRCQTAGAWTDFNLLIILFSTFILFCFFLFLFLRIRLMSSSKHLSVISKVLEQWRSDYISRIIALFSLNSDMFPNALGSFSFTGYWNCLISKVN